MNRKLHTPIFACAASTATLVLGLLVAWPAFPADDASAAAPSTSAVESRTPEKASTDQAATPPRSRSKRARNAIAMPYFSFARGAGGRS